MSRIGRLPVAIPAGVEVSVAAGNVVTVKGPKGTLERALPTEMEIKVEDLSLIHILNTMNVYDVMKHNTVVVTKDAVASIEEVYA